MSGWADIASAPRDGTRFLVASPMCRDEFWQDIVTLGWLDADDRPVFVNDDCGAVRNATHWMPLPEAPTPSGTGETRG
jgi:hypothetical protein